MLRGAVSLPSLSAMQSEAHLITYAWSELDYYDKLLRDMHVQTRRKPTLYRDLMQPTNPLEYKSVIIHRV